MTQPLTTEARLRRLEDRAELAELDTEVVPDALALYVGA